jgi:hypothetical protein
MRSKFPGYYKLTEADLRELWAEATFVIDTNVLLSFYRYPQKARDETIATLRGLRDRLWIPFHVALEFQRNRLGVIHKQNSEFENILGKIEKFNPIIKSIGELKDRHSLIDPSFFIESINESIARFVEEVKNSRRSQSQVHEDDLIRKEIDKLLEGRIGEEPSRECVTKWQDSGKKRYPSKIPPGYLDAEKEKDKDQQIYSYGGNEYHKIYGDLIIWNQIIEHCQSDKITKLIFVTDDTKEDWWEEIGGKTIGPRPELVEEIRRLGGVTHFNMYNSGSFLENAKRFVGAKVGEETIGQVREISNVARISELRGRILLYDRPLIDALSVWVRKNFGGEGLISFGDSGRYAAQKDGTLLGIELCDVRYLAGSPALRLIHDKVNTAISLSATSVWQNSHIFIVSEDVENLEQLRGHVERFLKNVIAPVTVNFATFDGEPASDLVVRFTLTSPAGIFG